MPSDQASQPKAQRHRLQHPNPSPAGGDRDPDQPHPQQDSREAVKAFPLFSNHDALESSITTLSLAYEACKNTIEGSRNLAATRCGEQCIGIIDRRLEFLAKDLEKGRVRMASAFRKANKAGIVVEPDDRNLTQKLRVQEDRLRRMQREALHPVANGGFLLGRIVANSSRTYEEEITACLRECYDQSREAISSYSRDFATAIERKMKAPSKRDELSVV